MKAIADRSRFLRRRALVRSGVFDIELPKELAERLWSEPERLMETGEPLRVTGQRSTVRINWLGRHYIIKQYRPTWWHFVRQLFSRSWASTTFCVTKRLIDAGIATPRPVACIENRWGVFRRASFLIYEYVDGVMLRTYLADPTRHRDDLTTSLSHQMSEFWQRVEELRLGLADAHTGNFIVGPAGKLWVIDLDKTRFHRSRISAAWSQRRAWAKFVRTAEFYGATPLARRRNSIAA